MSKIPFVEFYRPKVFEDIVLDNTNKTILRNIIATSYFPNLLLYGPPGTGKTTTIINLINAYQEKNNQKTRGLVIHLNASDERGIDIIRNQINQFVNSQGLFHQGMKFVILDEVDYMTINAQQALRYLLQTYSGDVRFCLICNYISRVDEGLQNEFVRLRFNQLPESDIKDFLMKIAVAENLNIEKEGINQIQQLYRSDIRSMINFMQSNQHIMVLNGSSSPVMLVVCIDVWESLFSMFCDKHVAIDTIIQFIHHTSMEYNMDKKNIIKSYLNYIIRNKMGCDEQCGVIITPAFLKFVENIMHFQDCKNVYYIGYAVARLMSLHRVVVAVV